MKIVINSCYGGFGLSREAIDRYCTEKGIHPGKWNDTYSYYMEFSEDEIPRDDEVLVKIVEELSTNVNGIGGKADGRFSELKIVEVPIKYRDRTYGETNISRFKHGIILLRMCAFASRKCKFI